MKLIETKSALPDCRRDPDKNASDAAAAVAEAEMTIADAERRRDAARARVLSADAELAACKGPRNVPLVGRRLRSPARSS